MDCILGLGNLLSSWLTAAREGVAKEGVESIAKEISERQVQSAAATLVLLCKLLHVLNVLMYHVIVHVVCLLLSLLC